MYITPRPSRNSLDWLYLHPKKCELPKLHSRCPCVISIICKWKGGRCDSYIPGFFQTNIARDFLFSSKYINRIGSNMGFWFPFHEKKQCHLHHLHRSVGDMFHNYEATVAPAVSAMMPGMPGMLPGPPKALLFRHPPAPHSTSNHRSEGRAISYICFFSGEKKAQT